MKTDPEFTVCIFQRDIHLSVCFCFFLCVFFLCVFFFFFFFFFFGSVWFDGQVNIIKVLSRWSVFLTTLFLVHAVNLYLCTFFPQKLTTALLEAAEGRE